MNTQRVFHSLVFTSLVLLCAGCNYTLRNDPITFDPTSSTTQSTTNESNHSQADFVGAWADAESGNLISFGSDGSYSMLFAQGQWEEQGSFSLSDTTLNLSLTQIVTPASYDAKLDPTGANNQITPDSDQFNCNFSFTDINTLVLSQCTVESKDGTYTRESTLPVSDPQSALTALGNQIQSLIQDKSCTDSSQCQSANYGYNACGGDTNHIIYSTAHTDQATLETLLNGYTELAQALGQGTEGSCAIVNHGPAICLNSICQEAP